jgi:segregation and condensation protein B
MSLKAKIEAVIYASEEPVTLAQLTGLLGEEGQSELNELDAQQHSLALEDESAESDDNAAIEPVEDADALNAEVTDSADETEKTIDAVEAENAIEATTAEAAVDGPSAADEKKFAKEKERKLRDYFRSLLDQLISDYANNDRGLEVREVAGGYRLATKPEYHDAVRGFVKSLKPPMKLSLQALETLAVVAYKQPVTAPEVSEIRGVDSAGVLGSLLTRKLVNTAGRKQVIGRPILYKTTKDFLMRFGLKDINELPSIEEFEKMAGELNEAVQEEIDMETPNGAATPHDGSPSLDEIHSAPEPTHVHHDTPEDLMSDKSTHPEGVKHEHADPHEVEPMAEIHSDQADGTPEDE